jgi:hypothetical protein
VFGILQYNSYKNYGVRGIATKNKNPTGCRKVLRGPGSQESAFKATAMHTVLYFCATAIKCIADVYM